MRGNDTVDCALLGENNLAAWEVLSRRASNWKLNELEKQEQTDRGELARKDEKLENELEVAEEVTSKLRGAVRV